MTPEELRETCAALDVKLARLEGELWQELQANSSARHVTLLVEARRRLALCRTEGDTDTVAALVIKSLVAWAATQMHARSGVRALKSGRFEASSGAGRIGD